jgi:hypothetical protein
MNIKETLEVFDAADSAFDAVIKACEDKEITLLDIRHLLGPVKVTATALAGRDKIPSEMKELDAAEMEVLAVRAVHTAEKAALMVSAISSLKS